MRIYHGFFSFRQTGQLRAPSWVVYHQHQSGVRTMKFLSAFLLSFSHTKHRKALAQSASHREAALRVQSTAHRETSQRQKSPLTRHDASPVGPPPHLRGPPRGGARVDAAGARGGASGGPSLVVADVHKRLKRRRRGALARADAPSTT